MLHNTPLVNANLHLASGNPEWIATKRTYITIIGGHGAGKTFLACALWDVLTGGILLDTCMISLGDGISAHTDGFNTLMVGKYGSTRKCGGMDTIKTADDRLYTALDLALSRHERVVIGEGMTINSQTMVRWLDENMMRRWKRRMVFIHLLPDNEEQIARILRRSGRTSIKEKYVKMKSDQFGRNDEYIHKNFPNIPILRVSCRYGPMQLVTHVMQQLQLHQLIERTKDGREKKPKRTIRIRRSAIRGT